MIYLLDTNVVSELRRARPHGGLAAWYQERKHEDLVIPAVVTGEIQQGAERTRLNDPEKAREIETWLEGICSRYPIIAADERVFRAQARMRATHKGLQYEDSLIAATAHVYMMVLATRNLKDFRGLGIAWVNPFDYR